MTILSITEIRQFVDWPTGTAADAALQMLIDAAESDIVEYAGPAGPVTELVEGGWTTLVLSRPILAVTSVTEDHDGTPLVLAADDYRHLAGGYVLHRLSTGTNPGSVWPMLVSVVHTIADESDQRGRVQAELVKLSATHNPGLTAQAIGEWSETYGSGEMTYAYERDMILSTLPGASAPEMVVI